MIMHLLSLRSGKSTSDVTSQLANRSLITVKIEPDEEAHVGADAHLTGAIFDEWAFGAEI